MANHPNRSTSHPSCYLWVATQSEPGYQRETFRVTADANPPPRIEPTPHVGRDGPTGLVEADSLYGPWAMLGTVKGECVTRDDPGDCVRRPSGEVVETFEVANYRWYSKVEEA